MKTQRHSEKGFALVESIAFLMGFVVLFVYAVDFFTAIHSGILGSISARTYLFETLQHRTDIRFLRQDTTGTGSADRVNFANDHYRVHMTTTETPPNNDDIFATIRPLTHSDNSERISNRVNYFSPNPTDQNQRATLIWLRTAYGICIDNKCSGAFGGP